jgi:hypothetical protein
VSGPVCAASGRVRVIGTEPANDTDRVALLGADDRSNRKWSAGLVMFQVAELNGGIVRVMARTPEAPPMGGGKVMAMWVAISALLEELVIVSSTSRRACAAPPGVLGAIGR